MAPEAKNLIDIVEKIIHTRRSEVSIKPSWVATEAMREIDPAMTAPPLIYIAAHLELRQIARQQLRLHFEVPSAPSEDERVQSELFPDLQWRYPAARGKADDEPEYVLLEEMSDDDYAYNIKRLRREGRAKLDHADALEAHWQNGKAARVNTVRRDTGPDLHPGGPLQ